MKRINIRNGIKVLSFSLLALLLLTFSSSCVPGDTEELLASILKNTDSGQITFVTEDGETVTVTITKTGQTIGTEPTEKTNDEPKNTASTPKPVNTATVKPTDTPKLADYLPVLNCIEDVFKMLGVWEQANKWHKEGYTWDHIALELGYNKDTMYASLCEIIKAQLHEARELGLINQEKFEYKLKYYSDLALKWVGKIFVS